MMPWRKSVTSGHVMMMVRTVKTATGQSAARMRRPTGRGGRAGGAAAVGVGTGAGALLSTAVVASRLSALLLM